MRRELLSSSATAHGTPEQAVKTVSKRVKMFPEAQRVSYKPEVRTCPACGAKLEYYRPATKKFVITLNGTFYAVNLGYRCPAPECPGHRLLFRSAVAEALSLKHHNYGMDVLVEIGHLRFHKRYTRQEILVSLQERGISISEREVQNLYEAYLVLLRCSAPARLAQLRPRMEANKGVLISLDGVQPEKGNEMLWVVREVLTGTTLNASNLVTSDAESIKELLKPVLELGLPVIGVVSDGQKSIRNAVAELFPGVPHQLCHFHYLKDIAVPAVDEDRALKTDLKHELRGIKKVEDCVLDVPGAEAEVVRDFATALRAELLEDGLPPFDLPGVKIYEQLAVISQSLQKCLAKRGRLRWRHFSISHGSTNGIRTRTVH